MGSRQGEQAPPRFARFRNRRSPFEEEVYELALAPPGGKPECRTAEFVGGIDPRSSIEQDPGRGGLTPLARAEDKCRAGVIIPFFQICPPLDQDLRSLGPVVHRRQVERCRSARILEFELGALVQKIVNERCIITHHGIMQRRHAVTVSRVEDGRGFLNESLDRLDVALAERVKNLLRPCRR